MPGNEAIVSLCGSSFEQRKVYAERIKKCALNMKVLPARAGLFRSTPLDKNMTHVIIEKENYFLDKGSTFVTNTHLRNLLIASESAEIPDGVKVVTIEWLHTSFQAKEFQDERKYLIELRDEPPVAPGSLAVKPGKEEQPLKRQRLDEESDAHTKSISSISTNAIAEAITKSALGRTIMLDKPLVLGGWTQTNGVVCYLDSRISLPCSSKQMVAFDMDGTVITTVSGKTFEQYEGDWRMWDDVRVLERFSSYAAQGAYLAIISNQAGIGKGKTDISYFQKKVTSILTRLRVPCDFICCTSDTSIFRKPLPGMWELLRVLRCPSADPSKSIYVGDAAGRTKVVGVHEKKDFSDSDLKLALNVGASFRTPEGFFAGSVHPLHSSFHSPPEVGSKLSSYVKDDSLAPPPADEVGHSPPDSPEIVVIVAPAACGKSTLCSQMANAGYTVVNQDSLKTVEKCIKCAEAAIIEQKSVVVDNTNISISTRKIWIDLATKCGVPIRCIHLTTEKDLCFLLEKFRLISPFTEAQDKRAIPKIVIHTMFKNLVEPSTNEGLKEVIRSPLELRCPRDEVERYIYGCYLT